MSVSVCVWQCVQVCGSMCKCVHCVCVQVCVPHFECARGTKYVVYC